ncbi:hypothetical protein [Paucisalibacillus sp. EB02]|uniref:hypothetical protein n=1 Tax=Paucisalibacillus sp. EB02 TaxID=1347087 RepID=UPI0004B34E8B|nr:hypothetical protein [Paucisalibacillus sp. EB02]
MEGFLILNRQNSMVYFDENKSIIKTYFKEISIETSQEQYELLIELLNTSRSEIAIRDLLKEYEDEKYVMKLLKVLYDAGSILIYPTSYNLSNYFQYSWFRVLLQYLPTNKDILQSCRLLDEVLVYITPEVDRQFPALKELLVENDVTVSREMRGELKNNDWVISMEYVDTHQRVIELSLSADKLVGINRTNNQAPYNKSMMVKGNMLSRESLLYKVGPYYAMLYMIKSIVGISLSTFSLNKEGKFYEYDLDIEDYKQTVEEFSFPEPTHSKGDLDYIGDFESFINRNPDIPISVSGWKDLHGDLFQMGFATYSLTDSVTKDTFVYAGLDYIETAMKSIVNGLSYYLNKDLKQADWMVSTPDSYYLDKVLLLLQSVEEPYTIYKIEQTNYPNKKLSQYLHTLNIAPEFFVKKYSNSNSYTVYLYDRENDKLYTDGKKTLNMEHKMFELALHYILIKNNPQKTISTIIRPTAHSEIEDLLRMDYSVLNSFEAPDEKSFIENGLRLFKHSNLHTVEHAWKYEEQLSELNLVVRKIEVKTYQNVSV